jgi:hypothetical protein
MNYLDNYGSIKKDYYKTYFIYEFISEQLLFCVIDYYEIIN